MTNPIPTTAPETGEMTHRIIKSNIGIIYPIHTTPARIINLTKNAIINNMEIEEKKEKDKKN